MISIFGVRPDVAVTGKFGALPGCWLPGQENSTIMRRLLYVLPDHASHLSNDPGRHEEVVQGGISIESLGNRVAVIRYKMDMRELRRC